ncbi:MAG: heme-binding protein, partial [Proteobacteria bacterium]|nr:heme-binding protein [Pseudomonadota bacterium]
GGIPIVVGGQLIGAIGCSGATGAQDAVVCQVGVDAIGGS